MDYKRLHVNIRPELAGLADTLIERLHMTMTELLTNAIFIFHPELFLACEFEEVKLWMFLDPNEQEWVKEVADFFNVPEEFVFHLVFELDDGRKKYL